MHIEEYQRIYELEMNHFWYRAMEQHVLRIVAAVHRRRGAILDAGCGTGRIAQQLRRFGPVTAVDTNDTARSYAKKRPGIRVMNTSVCDLHFPDESFDLVVCLDVLYHRGVPDDRIALREFFRVLSAGGLLLLRLPAFELLRGAHDVTVETRHRYTTAEVREKVQEAGFVTERLTYANMLLGIPILFKRMIERIAAHRPSSDTFALPHRINRLFYTILSAENRLLSHISLPFGSSVVCVCRKPDRTAI